MTDMTTTSCPDGKRRITHICFHICSYGSRPGYFLVEHFIESHIGTVV